jgi:hypothetical protein
MKMSEKRVTYPTRRDRINPWENPKKRAAIMRGIRLAAKKRRKRK